MSGAARFVREQIAAALTAGGAAGQPYPPDIASPPMAWPARRSSVATGLGHGITITWDVFVVPLPAASAEQVDDLADDLADALSNVGTVTTWEPVRIPVSPAPGANEINAYRFQLSTDF